MKLYFFVEHPHTWALLNRRDEVVDSGSCEELELLPISERLTQLVGVVPGGLVTIHKIQLSARSRSKAVAAIPYALEDSLATDVEDLTFSMLEWRSGEEAIVAVLENARIQTWQQEFRRLPRYIDALVPEQLLVPAHPQAQYTLAKKDDGTVLIRSGEFEGFVIDENTLDLWWQSVGDPHAAVAVSDLETARYLIQQEGTLVSEWDIGADFTKWMQFGETHADRINLLQETSGPQNGSSPMLKVAMIFLGLSFASKVALDGYEYYKLSNRDDAYNREIVQVFKDTFPDVSRIVNPRLQMEQRLKQLKTGAIGAGQFQFLLSAIAVALPRANATLEEVTFRDNELIITCSTKDFAGLDNLKQHFAQDTRIRAELMSSGSRENRVSGRFKLVQV